MTERQIEFFVGVTYDIPVEKMETLGQIVKSIIEGIEKTRFDRAHFSGFNDSFLGVVIVYYILSFDYNEYIRYSRED